MYYFTLFVTPAALISGVFFPLDQLPAAFQTVAHLLPLSHAVELVRPLLLGGYRRTCLCISLSCSRTRQSAFTWRCCWRGAGC